MIYNKKDNKQDNKQANKDKNNKNIKHDDDDIIIDKVYEVDPNKYFRHGMTGDGIVVTCEGSIFNGIKLI